MFLVLLFLTLCVHAVDCPWWQPRTGVMTHGGGGCTTQSPGSLSGAPGASGGGNSGGTSPGAPPFGEVPGTGPPGWLEGVDTPTAHEGAPARGDGPGSSLGEGCSPGSGEGPHTTVGVWRYNKGHSRRGGAAPPPIGCDRRGGWRTPLPLPPPRGERGPEGRHGGEHNLSGERQRRGGHQPPTPRVPHLDLLTSKPGVAVTRTEAPCPQGAPHRPQLTRACGLTGTGAAASQITPAPYWASPARVAVGTAAVPAPAAPLLEWPQCPDPRPGWRVSIRPQASPGSGAGPHATVGGWRYNRGCSRRGTAAPPSAPRGRDGGRGPPPTRPPPPPERDHRGLEGR